MALFDYLEIFPLSDVFRRYGNIVKLILILFRFIFDRSFGVAENVQ